MIDPATGWVEIREIPTKRADVVANIVDATWFTRYPLPTVITFDRGSEFMAEFAQMVTVNYGIKKRGITTRNPQANAIIERMHQTLGNMIRTFPKDAFELDDPWTGILAATMFALRATVHTTLKATPTQLVFGRDAILNSTYVPDWDAIKQQKQQKIIENNRRENAKRKDYTYKVNNQVLHLDAQKYKYGRDVYNGPYKILQVFNNGTVRLQLQHYADVVNIRQIKPYKI
jgi:transposase InsO family protein